MWRKFFIIVIILNMGKQKDKEIIGEITSKKYPYGFVSDFDSDTIGKGLNKDVVRLISRKKMNQSGCLRGALKLLRHFAK